MELKGLVERLWPLHRTLVSDGTDEALRILGEYIPSSAGYSIETYPPGTKVWTWRVPERYVVHEAYLETEDGARIVDFGDNPLHLVSYSLPVDQTLTWPELEPHLHFSPRRPHAIPWEFKFYERDWGFCLRKVDYDRLPRDKLYRAVIRTEFIQAADEGLRVGAAVVNPEVESTMETGELLISSHICHPYQANDDVAGVATAVEVIRRLQNAPLPPGSMSVRFVFGPETIGSICYLSHHEDLIPQVKGAIFVEMTGNRNSLALQRSWQDNHLMDRIGRHVLERRASVFREEAFRELIGNDEMVINGPGVNIPCISISRFPYDEYHTSDDTPDIIHEDMLQEAADVIEAIVRTSASNYVPKRRFRGPVFLSAYGLWVDWRANLPLNRAVEKIMLCMDGRHTVFDIAERLELDYFDVRNYVESFRANGLVEMLPVPSVYEGP